ncbi:riboflavin synthase subunit alpha [Thalassotalea ponticola]|uniref:riboflavin synthase subunit alpha n=1 Tax=Thalassotalea ponticola TaxID=1523392 RepID=UPI0025B5D808|nr:riboflavin synthase subunit alpha [Thalassotalea ponticola]MDN3651231.1 riboflavin synthase subunit alpha [Thalassotalea ponticola]
MFTGIVQSTATVTSIKEGENFRQLTVRVPIAMLDNLAVGASVATNGVCLTAVAFDRIDECYGFIVFDVIDETLRLTNLATLNEGSRVNIERSLTVGDELGGHMVSGHIHCMATLVERTDSKDNCRLCFSIDKKWRKYLFAKGFISVNGCSLTLGEVEDERFFLHLIPETLRLTNLSLLTLGDAVNIEFDQQTMTIVESIERIMAQRYNQ